MIEYVLQWLENAGITDILVVSTPESSSKLSHYLSKVYETTQTIGSHIELVCPPAAYGTADALRAVKDKISHDFFVVPCDIITNYPLERLMDSFRLSDAAISAVFSTKLKHEYSTSMTNGGVKVKEPKTFTGLDADNKRLLALDIKQPTLNSGGGIGGVGADDRYNHVAIHMPILEEYGTVNIYSDLHDVHVYLIKRWVLDWICEYDEIENLREDVLPLLVKCQFSESMRSKVNLMRHLPELFSYQQDFCDLSEEQLYLSPAMRYLSIDDTTAAVTTTTSTSTVATGDRKEQKLTPGPPITTASQSPVPSASSKIGHLGSTTSKHDTRISAIKCLANVNVTADTLTPIKVASPPLLPSSSSAVVAPINSNNHAVNDSCSYYCVRVNTIPAYFDLHRHIDHPLSSPRIASTAEISPNAQVGPDSIVGEGTKIGERTSVKKTVIGSHCVIGKFVKLSNSIIMDYVVIEDGAKLENCIVSSGANLGAKCNLRDCEIGSRFSVSSGTSAKGERLLESRTMLTEEEDY